MTQATRSSSADAEAVVRNVLARGAGAKAILLALVGLALLVPGGLCAAGAIQGYRSLGLGDPPHLSTAGEQCLIAAIPLVLGGLYLFLVKGVRAFGARGTRVGRITLDFPARASVQPIVRDIRVNGVHVRSAHLLSITVDGGDMLEIQVSPAEMPQLLAAFAAWCGTAAVDRRVLEMGAA
jgi:hypothetical protein